MSRSEPGLLIAFILSFGVNLLVLTVSVYMLQVYDRVLTSHSSSTLFYLTMIALVALLVMAALDIVRARVLVRLGVWIDRVLTPLVFARLVGAPSGRQAEGVEALRDVSTLRNFLGGASVTLMDAPWTPLYLGFIYLLHPWLGHVALAGAALLFVLALAANMATRGLLQEAGAVSARGYRMAGAAVRNADAVLGMGLLTHVARRVDALNAYGLGLQARASDRSAVISAAAKALRMSLQIAILGAGAMLVLDNKIGPGAMVAASIIMGRALAPVEQAIAVWKQVIGARAAYVRLDDLFREGPASAQATTLPAPEGRLDVEGVTFRPDQAREPVLANVAFRLEPGEALAVVGPSGAGKSTLAKLLLGLAAPSAGAVRLDGADVRHAVRAQYGRYIGFMPQSVELFPGSIRDNIGRLDRDAESESIVAAAQLAGVHEMILRLPDGYETQVRENGAPLSGGQLQRIGLARALYGGPRLVVLDEPNSSLDKAGEDALNAAIEALKRAGATIVVIAHRPSMMQHMDKILVLKEGRVQMFGDRDDVLGRISPPAPPKRVRIVS